MITRRRYKIQPLGRLHPRKR